MHKCGYEVIEELVKIGDDARFILKSCYTVNGDYIGDEKTAHFLCCKKGIRPEKISPEHSICSIGFSKKEKKWYGWSHRAIYGFGIGSEVKIGDCAFVPSCKKEFIESQKLWFSDEMYKNVKFLEQEEGLNVSYDIVQQKIRLVFFCYIPYFFEKREFIHKLLPSLIMDSKYWLIERIDRNKL